MIRAGETDNVRRVQVTLKFDTSMSFLALSNMLHRLGFARLEISEFYDTLVD